MKRLLCMLLLASGAAAAQPASRPVENVTVTGPREGLWQVDCPA